MRQFEYTIKHPEGIPAPVAVQLIKAVNELGSTVTIKKADGKIVSATMFTAILGLNVNRGDEVIVSICGGDEIASMSIVEQFFKDTL